MSDTKKIPSGSVNLKPTVLSRCPHCAKPNPIINVVEIGESADSVLVAFLPACCKKIIGCQMIEKANKDPLIEKLVN